MPRSLILPMTALVCLLGHIQPLHAAIPLTDAICADNIEVHAEEDGPIYVNGRETSVKQLDENHYEAFDSESGVTVSLRLKPNGGVDVSSSGHDAMGSACAVARHIVTGTNPTPATAASSTDTP